ncbi:hypothetical protein D3C81_1466050 [compost metagenome]
MLRWRQVGAQATQQRHSHQSHRSRRQAGSEQRLEPCGNHRRQPFAGLQQDIADEAIAHHHISQTAIEAIPLYVTDEIHSIRRLKQVGGQLHLLVTLDLFRAHIQQSHTRPDLAQRLGGHGAHDGELVEVLGTAVDVGAKIQQMTTAGLRRHRSNHGRPVDAR